MLVATTILGILFIVMGVCAVVAPGQMLKLADWKYKRVVYFAAGVRLVAGTIFLLAAPQTRFPTTLGVLGVIALVAGVITLIVPAHKWIGMIEWWLNRPLMIYRLCGLLVLALGAFVVYASV